MQGDLEMGDIDKIKELQRKRFQFLRRLYELSEGNIHNWENMFLIDQELGLDKQSTINVTDYLWGEGLLKPTASGGLVGITHPGIKEVEEALTYPDRETEHFLPINVIQIGTMSHSQIQQGSPGATQVVTINEVEKKELEEIIQSLKESGDQLNLKEQEKVDFQANIETIEAQMSSSKSRKPIIIETLKAILASAAGTLLASGLTQQISAWIGG